MGLKYVPAKSTLSDALNRIKRFMANSETAVKTQIWCAIAVYVLIAIIKKELNLFDFKPDSSVVNYKYRLKRVLSPL